MRVHKRNDKYSLFHNLITVTTMSDREIDLTWPFWIIVVLFLVTIVS